MKPTKSPENGSNRLYWIIAILCLVYAGVSLIVFVRQLDATHAREQRPRLGGLQRNLTANGDEVERVRSSLVLSLIVNFFGMVTSLLAGISLLNLLRNRESKALTKELLDSIILPDEKLVIQSLEANGGELTQSELVKQTDLSKVKIHRIVKRLEEQGIVKKYPYGLTNKIRLEKKFSTAP